MNEEEPLVNINSSALLLNRNYFDGPLLSFHVLVHLYHKHLMADPCNNFDTVLRRSLVSNCFDMIVR